MLSFLKLQPFHSHTRVPLVRQLTPSDCGAACLAMVLRYLGCNVTLAQIREEVGFGPRGVRAKNLLQAAERFGFHGTAVKLEELDDLRLLPRGAVLHWAFNHYVVFESFKSGHVQVLDPALGPRWVAKDEATRAITGIALLFGPASGASQKGQELRKTNRRGALPRYLMEILSLPRLNLWLLLTSLLLQGLALVLPLFMAFLVDQVIPRREVSLMAISGVALAVIIGFHFLATMTRANILLHVRTLLDSRLTRGFVTHLTDLPFQFFQKRSTADLMLRINSNEQIRDILTTGALTTVLDGILVSTYLLLILWTHYLLGCVVLGLGVLRILVYVAVRSRYRGLRSETLQIQARGHTEQLQIVSGIKTIKGAGTEPFVIRRWSAEFSRLLNVSIARGKLDSWVDSFQSSFAIGAPLLVLWVGAGLVLRDEISLGLMLAVSALAAGFLVPLGSLVSSAFRLEELRTYSERLQEVFEEPTEQDRQRDKQTFRFRGNIHLDNVSFRYELNGPEVLLDVSLKIDEGSFVAFVGRSGVGKSTLAHVLSSLYQPTGGRILFDGHDLRDLDLRALRSQMGIVPQETYLLNTTIRENLAMGDPDLPFSRLVEAAKSARIHDEILRLPMGYDTILAEGGSFLSGGQRQRIALARALAPSPRLLVLDEATNAVDAPIEDQILTAIRSYPATRILVSHRLNTVRHADYVFVLYDGRIVEQGPPEELLRSRGIYSDLFERQMSRSVASPH